MFFQSNTDNWQPRIRGEISRSSAGQADDPIARVHEWVRTAPWTSRQSNSIDAKFLKLENILTKLMSISSQPPVDINVCNVVSSIPKRKIKNLVSKPPTKSDSSQHRTLTSWSTDIDIDNHNNFVETPDVNNGEIVLTNIINDCDFGHKRSALAIIETVIPTITAEDIVCYRLAGRRDKASSDITSYTRPPQIFVKMRSSSLVRNVIAAKKIVHTSDLEPSSLSKFESSKIITTNIYINEALEAHSFRYFLNLKSVAKRLGLKYIWHRKGSFLAKWNDGKRQHVFTSATDLVNIAETYKPSPTSSNRSKDDWLCQGADAVVDAPAKGLRAGFLNAGTFKGHIDDFLQYLRDNPSYDIFGVAESRLSPLLKNDPFALGGSSLVRQDRNLQGGGIALYIKSTYKFIKLAYSNTTTLGKPLVPEYLMGLFKVKI